MSNVCLCVVGGNCFSVRIMCRSVILPDNYLVCNVEDIKNVLAILSLHKCFFFAFVHGLYLLLVFSDCWKNV